MGYNDSCCNIWVLRRFVVLVIHAFVGIKLKSFTSYGEFDFVWITCSGATLGKGLNRGMGTILGGGLGCLTATLAEAVGGSGNSIIVGAAMLIFGKV